MLLGQDTYLHLVRGISESVGIKSPCHIRPNNDQREKTHRLADLAGQNVLSGGHRRARDYVQKKKPIKDLRVLPHGTNNIRNSRIFWLIL